MPQISLTNLDKFAQYLVDKKLNELIGGTTFNLNISIVPRNPNAENDASGQDSDCWTDVGQFSTSNDYAVIPKGFYILNQNPQNATNHFSGFKITGIPFSVFGSDTIYNGFGYGYDSSKRQTYLYYIQSDETEDKICFRNSELWEFYDTEYGPQKIGICIKKDVYINITENSDWNSHYMEALGFEDSETNYIFKKWEKPQVGSILKMGQNYDSTEYSFLVLESNYSSPLIRVVPVDYSAEFVQDNTLNSGVGNISSLSALPAWVPEILKDFRIFGANIEGVSILDMQNCIERLWDNGENYNLALQYQTSAGDNFGPVEPGSDNDLYVKHKSLIVPLMLEDVIRFFKLVTSESGIQNSTNGELNIQNLWRYMLPGYSGDIGFTWNRAILDSGGFTFEADGLPVPVYAISPALFEWAKNNQSSTNFSYTITKINIPGVNA